MNNKIQELADKLLIEGVKKGEDEAQILIREAHRKADIIIAEAEAKAEELTGEAERACAALEKNTRNELSMFAGQALNAVKSQVADVVSGSLAHEAAASLAADKDFVKRFALKLAEGWNANEELVISSSDAEEMKSYFAANAKALLDKGVEFKIASGDGRSVALSVAPKDGSYRVDFGEEEFERYFMSLLRPQLVEMLFDKE